LKHSQLRPASRRSWLSIRNATPQADPIASVEANAAFYALETET
jgi:hypothetical protein